MANNVFLTYDELNIIDIAVRQRMEDKRFRNNPSYQALCKALVEKVRAEQRRQEIAGNIING